jgi:hypothetical protein
VAHVPHWGYTNTGRNRIKCILHRDVTTGIFAPLNIYKKIHRFFLIFKQPATILSRRKRLVYSYTMYITAGAVRQSEQLSAYLTTILSDVLSL